MHHAFDGVGVDRAGEPFAGRLFTFDHRHRHVILGERGVNIQHAERFFDGLLLGGMGRMAFLPEKFGRAQKQPGAQFPADDIGPLVDQDRQIAIRLHPLGIHRADDRFAGGPNHERFFKLTGGHQPAAGGRFEPMMRHHGAFLGESLDVGRLFFQVTQRNEERKIGVLMARVFEHLVQHSLHVFPDGIAPRLDDHAAADRRILGQIGPFDGLLIPLGIIFFTGRRDRVFRSFGHDSVRRVDARMGESKPRLILPNRSAVRKSTELFVVPASRLLHAEQSRRRHDMPTERATAIDAKRYRVGIHNPLSASFSTVSVPCRSTPSSVYEK